MNLGFNKILKHTVMWGAGSQARVNRPILEDMGCSVVALIDNTPGLESPFEGTPIFQGWETFLPWLRDWKSGPLGFVVAIGNPHGDVRQRLHRELCDYGLIPVSFTHPSAVISESAVIEDGVQIMPQAVVHVDARIGKQCIINTGASVDHDCVLADGVEIAPGAVLCGEVVVGENTWVCAGATVLPRIRIGANVIVGAGSMVNYDVADGVTVVGVPARPINK